MKKNSVYDCTIIELPQVHNEAGNITAIENNKNIPFEVKRIYYLYDIPGCEDRGAHGHKKLQQVAFFWLSVRCFCAKFHIRRRLRRKQLIFVWISTNSCKTHIYKKKKYAE